MTKTIRRLGRTVMGGKYKDDGKKTNSGSRAIETIYTRDVVCIARHMYTVQYNNYMHKQWKGGK